MVDQLFYRSYWQDLQNIKIFITLRETLRSSLSSLEVYNVLCCPSACLSLSSVGNVLLDVEWTWNKKSKHGLPWWRSGWESACQCRGHGFEPWSGRIPHAAEQLGPWATTAEPVRLEPVLCNKRGRDSERPVHCDEEWPPLAATGGSPRTETKAQHTQK